MQDFTQGTQGRRENTESRVSRHTEQTLHTLGEQVSDLDHARLDDRAANAGVLSSPTPVQQATPYLRTPAKRPKASLHHLQGSGSPVMSASPGSLLRTPARRFRIAAIDDHAKPAEDIVLPTDVEFTHIWTIRRSAQRRRAGEL
ncbi:uncharacterized protein MYCFIDRAFT_212716 [Pseudocercospora fijiensis CIRAD86]|uniref:Uncharacterized protein n=1 Tax=Pseudocercospora fijiensis (strain CIRAD86) TaxID=383855 RepID=M2ZD37_PSEFD|nr:uncharacterized protein MYCFIDRAFT_212716 [Pseudocercospora fijiensis CIRAD86]EME77034.1 hypothetical protein MYCFIDRAFT_212716 [Pseudocercospora fijiensis CIRAD86]